MGPEFFILLVLAVPYFVPSIVAVTRKMPNKGSTIVVNVAGRTLQPRPEP